jgi:hypothetical protein
MVRIKEEIWSGKLHRGIAYSFDISIHTVRSIVAGDNWARIPWPDGSTGSMSQERKIQIAQIRYNMSGRKLRKGKGQPGGNANYATIRVTAIPITDEEEYRERIRQGMINAAKAGIEGAIADPTEQQVTDMIAELKEIDRKERQERNDRMAKEAEESHRLYNIEYEARLAELAAMPPDDEPETEQQRKSRLILACTKKGQLVIEVLDQMPLDWVIELTEVNIKSNTKHAPRLVVYLEERRQRDAEPECTS